VTGEERSLLPSLAGLQRRARAARDRAFTPLRRAVRIPVWGDLGLRLGAALLLVSLVILVHWLSRDGLTDSHDGSVSFLDVVYFTMISVTTTGYGDIVPVSDKARLIEALIVTPVRVLVLLIFIGAAYTFVLKQGWEKWRMARIQERLSGHIVVLGYGISGSEAVAERVARGTDPRCIVVMDTDPERLAAAGEVGCNVIEADATRDEHLMAVQIARAKAVLISAGRDDASILIVLTARHLAPRVPISVVIRADDNELLARQAGADNVINPVRFTGLLLAGSAQGAHTAEYIADLASIGGRVQLVERAVLAEEVGKSIDQLASGGRGLRIYRGGATHGFWEPEAQRLAAGDVIVEITPTAASDAVPAD
jgi:voltage-gated potassium channel